MNSLKLKYIVIKLILIVTFASTFCLQSGHAVVAIEKQNSHNLYRVELQKKDANQINVNLYTSDSYSHRLIPKKHFDGNYVLLLPYTLHSITSQPDLSNLEGLIKRVDVKLMPNKSSEQNSSYTKLTIVPYSSKVKVLVNNIVVKNSYRPDLELERIINGPSKEEVKPKKEPVILATSLGNKVKISSPIQKKVDDKPKTDSSAVKNINKNKDEKLQIGPQIVVREDMIKNQTHDKQQILVNESYESGINKIFHLGLINNFIDQVKYNYRNSDKRWVYIIGLMIIAVPIFLIIALKIFAAFATGRKPYQPLENNFAFTDEGLERHKALQETFSFKNQEIVQNSKPFIVPDKLPETIRLESVIKELEPLAGVAQEPTKGQVLFEEIAEPVAIDYSVEKHKVEIKKEVKKRDPLRVSVQNVKLKSGSNDPDKAPWTTVAGTMLKEQEVKKVNDSLKQQENDPAKYKYSDPIIKELPNKVAQSPSNLPPQNLFYQTPEENVEADANPLSKESLEVAEEQKAPVMEIREDDINTVSCKSINENAKLYLVNVKDGQTLIGEINGSMLVLENFDNTFSKSEIYVKYAETKAKQDVYLVRIEGWKAMIGLNSDSMELLLVL